MTDISPKQDLEGLDRAVAIFKAQSVEARICLLHQMLHNPLYFSSSDSARFALTSLAMLFNDMPWVFDHSSFAEQLGHLFILAHPEGATSEDNSPIHRSLRAQ